MTELSVKKRLGVILIASHFAVILLIAVFMSTGALSPDEGKISLAILIPVFTSFASLIIKFFVDTRTQLSDSSNRVNGVFAAISYFIGVIFVLFVTLVIINQAYFNKQDSERFTTLLGLSETVFGVYLGFIVKGLFEKNVAEESN